VRADPIPAGDAQRADRAGVAPRDIQYEVFGPDLWQADLD
jgi:nitric oxide dioxygenase